MNAQERAALLAEVEAIAVRHEDRGVDMAALRIDVDRLQRTCAIARGDLNNLMDEAAVLLGKVSK